VAAFDRAWQDTLTEVSKNYLPVGFPLEWQFSRDRDSLLTDKFWE
jgi:hypothetical protein